MATNKQFRAALAGIARDCDMGRCDTTEGPERTGHFGDYHGSGLFYSGVRPGDQIGIHRDDGSYTTARITAMNEHHARYEYEQELGK